MILCITFLGCKSPANDDANLRTRAHEIAHKYIIVDGHIDVPYRMSEYTEDITRATNGGDFDYPRAKAGGLDAPFMSIYLPSERQKTPGASKALADSLIDLVEGFVQRAPDKFALAKSTDDVRNNFAKGLISLPMGMENGSGIENDLANLKHFYDRGIRYITLTHAKVNLIGDSSYDSTRVWNGLSPFGEKVVDEMNRLGIIVDISHVTDSTFYDVIRRTKAPVMASHSASRHFTPGWERNMNDDMAEKLAENGGVVMVAFGSAFLSSAYAEDSDSVRALVNAYLDDHQLTEKDPEGFEYYTEQRNMHPIGSTTDVADHIDHFVHLIGVDHVGFGSDFDGVFARPAGLMDVAGYPNLIEELLRRGYSEEDIAKIMGGNALRVWSEVERVAKEEQAITGTHR